MKIILVVFHLAVSFSGVAIYHWYWKAGIGQISRCLNDDSNTEAKHSKYHSESTIKNSSVWCWGSSLSDRLCYFHNLYFHLNEFLFVNGMNSVYYGMPESQFDPALLDLSSVHDHNGQYFNYVNVLYEKSQKMLNPAKQVFDLTLMFHRFLPDNLMHVFHDDLIPVFHTMGTFAPIFQTSTEDFQLFFVDNRSPGKYKHLYEAMSSKKPLYRSELSSQTICFSRVLVGLMKNTTWYQYGFVKPQGPLSHRIEAYTLKRFAQFMRRKLNLESSPQMKDNLAVLLVRKGNRLILNEVELAYRLVHDLGLKVEVMSQESHSLADIILKVSTAGLLVGIHGSLLIISLFLPAGALLVELFPYAINPDNYTPYKTLAGMPGMNISYASWRNVDNRKTWVHPDRAPHEGGIRHLSLKEQEEVMSSSEVPLHLCCDDPRWLFRIYQDTEVNVEQVVDLVVKNRQSSLREISLDVPYLVEPTKRILPYRIGVIKCSIYNTDHDTFLSINWEAPLNFGSVDQKSFVYELWLQESGTDQYLTFRTFVNSCKLTSREGIRRMASYHVWIRGVVEENIAGPFNNFKVTCTTS